MAVQTKHWGRFQQQPSKKTVREVSQVGRKEGRKESSAIMVILNDKFGLVHFYLMDRLI